ncbi:MAG TPA: capsule biosynthesis protein CapA [Bacteroidetes bacterium]|nr:capsule biosynthesis protein CapA [Bacteroidota bacterium]
MKNELYPVNKLLSSFTIVFIFLLTSGCTPEQKQSTSEKKPDTNSTQTTIDPDSLYSIIMVGDMMLGTNYPSAASLPPDDGRDILSGAADILQSADVTIGNLEGTLLNSGGTPKVCQNPENCVAFRSPEHYAGYIKAAGFDMMNLANNHAGDMGDIGRKSTQSTLKKYGIEYAGQLTAPTAIFVKDGIKFGLTGFAPNTGTLSINDHTKAAEIVRALKKQCDIVIVAFHGGAEGSGATHVTRKREFYLGEDRGNCYLFAHDMIDAGADIVFGHGPHVPRGVELYKGKFIAYSLGNFCTYGKFGLSGNLGLAPILKLYITKSGDLSHGRIYPYKQIKRGFPVFDDDYGAVKLMKNMTETDFPETGIQISPDGKITKK